MGLFLEYKFRVFFVFLFLCKWSNGVGGKFDSVAKMSNKFLVSSLLRSDQFFKFNYICFFRMISGIPYMKLNNHQFPSLQHVEKEIPTNFKYRYAWEAKKKYEWVVKWWRILHHFPTFKSDCIIFSQLLIIENVGVSGILNIISWITTRTSSFSLFASEDLAKCGYLFFLHKKKKKFPSEIIIINPNCYTD